MKYKFTCPHCDHEVIIETLTEDAEINTCPCCGGDVTDDVVVEDEE